MNLRYFYYHTFFDGVDLRQPPKKSDWRETLDDRNEGILRDWSRLLCAAAPPLPHCLPPGNVAPLSLRVQNPGLLPGIGYPHEVGYPGEFKLGFHFDHTTGLPVLPGSSVKGVLRSVFPQYEYAETAPSQALPGNPDQKKTALQGPKARFVVKLLQEALSPSETSLPESTRTPEGAGAFAHRLELALFEGWNPATLSSPKPERLPLCRRAVFFDAFPAGYAAIDGQNRLLGRDALTPHGADPLKNPTPLPFVKVLPGVVFTFSFRLFPLTVEGVSLSPEVLRALFAAILEKTGIGAKTSVGYGRLFGENQPAAPPAGAGRQAQGPGQAAAATTAVAAPKAAQALLFSKALNGKTIAGEVTRAADGEVWFSIPGLKGFDGEVSDRNPSWERFVPGKRYELRVSEVRPEQRALKVKIISIKPLD